MGTAGSVTVNNMMITTSSSRLCRKYFLNPHTSIIFDTRGLILSLNHDSLCCRSRLLLAIVCLCSMCANPTSAMLPSQLSTHRLRGAPPPAGLVLYASPLRFGSDETGRREGDCCYCYLLCFLSAADSAPLLALEYLFQEYSAIGVEVRTQLFRQFCVFVSCDSAFKKYHGHSSVIQQSDEFLTQVDPYSYLAQETEAAFLLLGCDQL